MRGMFLLDWPHVHVRLQAALRTAAMTRTPFGPRGGKSLTLALSTTTQHCRGTHERGWRRASHSTVGTALPSATTDALALVNEG